MREQPIDLIFMDIMMPEMDGLHATVKLWEETNVPIILLTAKSESVDKVPGLNIAKSLTELRGGTFSMEIAATCLRCGLRFAKKHKKCGNFLARGFV